jgi:hypothetical protein
MSLDAARKDFDRLTNNGGFGVSLTLTPLSGSAKTIKGFMAKHHTTVDTDGFVVNSKNARVTIVEKNLTDVGYVVRNAKNEVDLRQHKVDFIDSTGILKHFIVKENWPDETLGVITCQLGDYGS